MSEMHASNYSLPSESSTNFVLSNEEEQTGLIQASDFRAGESSINDALAFISKHGLSNKTDPTIASTQMHESSYRDTNPLQSDYRAALIQNATRSVMNHIKSSSPTTMPTQNPSYVNANDQVSYEPSADNFSIATRKARKIVGKHTSSDNIPKRKSHKKLIVDEYD